MNKWLLCDCFLDGVGVVINVGCFREINSFCIINCKWKNRDVMFK